MPPSRPSAIPPKIDPALLPPLLPHRPKLLLHRALHAIRQHDRVLDHQPPERIHLDVLALAHPHRHALALHDLDLAGLHDSAARARQAHGAAVKVRQVARPGAEPGFPEREHFLPEEVAALAAEEGAVGAVGRVVVGSRGERGFLLVENYDEVTGDPVGGLVCFVLVRDALALGHAALDAEGVGCGFAHNAAAAAGFAGVFDGLALAAALVAGHLHLLEDARREHVLLHHHTSAAALPARVHGPVRAAGALALLANLLLLDLEFVLGAGVEIPQWHRHADFHVGPAALAATVARVAAAAKEAAEEVKGIVRAAAGAVALLVLFQAFVAILVVDFAGFGNGEGVVGFGNFDKLLCGGVISSGIMGNKSD